MEKIIGMDLLGRPRCRGQDNVTCVVKTETGALGTAQFGCGQEKVWPLVNTVMNIIG